MRFALLAAAVLVSGCASFKGIEPDCESNTRALCRPITQGPRTNPVWNPLFYFDTVRNDHQQRNIQ